MNPLLAAPNINRQLGLHSYERYRLNWQPDSMIYFPPETRYEEAVKYLANRFTAWVWRSRTAAEVVV